MRGKTSKSLIITNFRKHLAFKKTIIIKMSLKQRKHLRQNLTNPEKIIWQKLRNRQIRGFKFRRQHNIGKFIVDFYCDEIKLIIEIDGDVHAFQEEQDKKRQIFLENRGMRIVRYTNYEVRDNLMGVLEDILKKCEELSKGVIDH